MSLAPPVMRRWHASSASTLAAYMKQMHLEANEATLRRSVDLVCNLFCVLAETWRRIFFVGTSQGAALAYVAASELLDDIEQY